MLHDKIKKQTSVSDILFPPVPFVALAPSLEFRSVNLDCEKMHLVTLRCLVDGEKVVVFALVSKVMETYPQKRGVTMYKEQMMNKPRTAQS